MDEPHQSLRGDGYNGHPGGDSPDRGLVLASLAMMLAMTGALVLTPILFVAPMPLAVLVYRNGYVAGTITAALTLLSVGFFQGWTFTGLTETIDPLQSFHLVMMIVLVTVGLIGMVIGGAWREGVPQRQTFLLTVVAALLPVTAVWAAARGLFDTDLLTVVFDNWMQLMRIFADEFAMLNADPELAEAVEHLIVDAETVFTEARGLLPGILTVVAMVGAFINAGLARWTLRKFGHEPPWFGPFSRWRLPSWAALGFIGGYALFLFGGDTVVAVVGENVLLVFQTLFAVQGVAVGWHLLSVRNVPVVLRTLLIAAVLAFAAVAATWIGVLDTWFNFRKKRAH